MLDGGRGNRTPTARASIVCSPIELYPLTNLLEKGFYKFQNYNSSSQINLNKFMGFKAWITSMNTTIKGVLNVFRLV